MNLWDLKHNQEATILKIEPESALSERLTCYGFMEGQKAKFLYKTLLGGPRVYLIGDTMYSLSRNVAHQIHINSEYSSEPLNSQLGLIANE